jgi:putative ABC transport system permease protein
MLGRRSQRDFEEEIRAHLALETERLRAQGMSPADAERAARRNFGNVGVAEDRFYRGQRLASVQDAGRDLRYAWRALRRTPGFLAVSVATLALAIGALTGMFSVVNAVILRPLPFAAPDRLVHVAATAPGSDLPERFSPWMEFYVHYKEHSQLLDGIFLYIDGTSTFRAGDRVERIPMAWPTNDMYATLGVRPALGRLPVPEDGDDAVVISDQLWSQWFGRDSSVLGKSYFVSDSMKRVVGIMQPGFGFPSEETMLWVSTPVEPANITPGEDGGDVVARLKDGVTPEQLAVELTRLSKQLPDRFGGSSGYARIVGQHRALVEPLLDVTVGPTTRRSLWLLLGAVGVVLLIACANVANLFAVRAEGRAREMTVRRAIGASRTQLVRLQMAEAMVVALAAGALALVLARVTLPLFIAAAPEGIPRLAGAGIDLATAAVAVGVVLLTALACGVVPALRGSSPDLARLREGGRGTTGRRRWGRDTLVAAQTALALVLLIGSALLVQSFVKLRNVDPGYDTADLYTFQFAPQQEHLTDGPSFGQLHLTMMERLRALPGVTAVGVVNFLPLDEGTGTWLLRTDDMAKDAGRPVQLNFTGGDYFQAMGIELLQGRAFTTAEAVSPNTSAIVSRSAAARLWPGANPLGQRLHYGDEGEEAWLTVVGVVEDVKHADLREAGEEMLYVPLTGPDPDIWDVGSPAYVVKSPRAELLQREVRELVRQLAPEAPVYREQTMADVARRSMIQLSFTMLTLGVVSGLALLLGAIGLYGVLSYVVAERRREIGVRMALGATARAVRQMVVAQGMRVVLIGVGIGVVVALASTRVLGALLYDVQAVDPLVFAAMSLMMLAIGALASWVPARRASGVNPIESLRGE